MAMVTRSTWLANMILLGCLAPLANAQQVHRNGFETLKTGWVRSSSDAPFDEKAHVITEEGAHDGQRCELLRLDVKQDVKQGTFIYYQYGVGKGPISEEFSARVWIKSNRPNLQLMARLILPNERDPNNLEYRMSTVLRGDSYRNVGRWQQVEIPRPQQLAKQVQQLMQAQLKRAVNFTDAYVDSLILNVYSGPGPTDVWIDDLEVGPVSTTAVPIARTPAAKPGRNQVVEFVNNQLLVGGKKLFFRGVEHSDTPLRVLRDAGFNTLFFDANASATVVKEASDLGFWLVPKMQVVSKTGQVLSSDEIAKVVGRYAENDAVLYWQLGDNLAREQFDAVTRASQAIQAADSGRPFGVDIIDSTLPFGRTMNLLSGHRFPIMTSLELNSYHDWLEQRRRLATPGSFFWTTVQSHAPDWQLQLLFDRTGQESYSEPVGPMAEQLRLMTYAALAAGYKGINYSSDRWLADSHQGRDRLLCCAMLNQEIEMLEPLLMLSDEPPVWIDTSVPDVKAAVMRTSRGTLVLPIWMGRGSQCVPGQAAVSKLFMTVPQVPQTMQAWEVHPADVHSLRSERVVGGTKITLPEFGLTTAIVFTADSSLVQRFQEQAKSRRQLVAQWSYDMALYELEKMRKVHGQLVTMGHTMTEYNHLLPEAENRLNSAKQLWESRNFGESYRESQRALRPVRIVMRSQWEKAVKALDTATSSPFAVSYFTLPRHWQFMESVGRTVPSSNVLIGGDFEIIPERSQNLWRTEDMINDEVDVIATRVGDVQLPPPPAKKKGPAPALDLTGKKEPATPPPTSEPAHEGKQCAMLQIKARKGAALTALERSRIALVSSAVRLPPGTIVQVTGWVRIVAPIKGSPDGAMFYDSVGGEDLAIRFTEPTPWKKYTLYRRVPASGQIAVHLALTGLGTVYFDDVRIEPLSPGPSGIPTASRPGSPQP